MPTAEENQAAAKDPRVGDRWKCNARGSDWLATVTARDNAKAKAKYTLERDGGKPIEYERTLKDFTSSIYASGWELIERGPAPAAEKPERDPHTTPVVGDEWEQNRETIKVVSINSDARVIQRITNSKRQSTAWSTPVVDWPEWVKGWRLHRKGDDPAWRPEGEKAEAVPEKKPVDYSHCGGIPWESVGKPAETSEQPAAGIKVGDRVRSISTGECGTVSEVSDYRAYAEFDSGYRDWMALHNWKTEWTIIPPAAAPEQDDTGDEPPASDRSSDGLTQSYQSDPVEEQHYRDSKYIRVIRSIGGKTAIEVDVYEVLEAFAVNCPATAHALKKILCAGIRGSKSRMQDLREARDSIMRAMEMQHQREAVAAAKGSHAL